MQNVLVTGGGGFVGRALVARLRENNVRVIALGRNDYPEVRAMGAEIAVGDIRDLDFLVEISRGCDTIFHTAAKAGIWGDRQEYFSINADGTDNVLEACARNAIPRLVYTSTPSVVFDGHDIVAGDESLPYARKFLCHYTESKARAEAKVLEANGGGFRTVALRPHLIWGPGDTNLIPRLLERGRSGNLRVVGDGDNLVDISYIDNVVEAHLLAAADLERQGCSAGRAYFISQGEPVNLWDWINSLFARLNIPPVSRRISLPKAWFAGGLMECYYKIRGLTEEPPMTRFLAEQLARSHWFSLEAAARDLGYRPRISTDEGVRRLIESFAKK